MKATERLTGACRVAKWLVAGCKLEARVWENVDRVSHAEDVCHVAIMPDVHLGRLVNNGLVAATTNLIYPQLVGSDIGCGLSAIAFQGSSEFLANEQHAQIVIKELYRNVPALKQRGDRILPAQLEAHSLSHEKLAKDSRRDGAYQVGTLGCGNHFAELQQDDAGVLWFMVHSGSRGMGQLITSFHLAQAATSRTGLQYLDLRTEPGQAYLNDMEWACQYATLNRLAIMACMVEILEQNFKISPNEDTYIDSPHNFARREKHLGKELLVHRKSAISAFAGEQGLIAGSMGTPSFIVCGRGMPDSLCSSSHGAGRAMSRSEARSRISSETMQRQLASVHYDRRNLSSLRDEAPAAYRDIREVMRAQKELTRQQNRLVPVLNFKYPDPRKD